MGISVIHGKWSSDFNADKIAPERKQVLISDWRENRMRERGAKKPYGLDALRDQVARQEKKLKKLTESKIENRQPYESVMERIANNRNRSA